MRTRSVNFDFFRLSVADKPAPYLREVLSKPATSHRAVKKLTGQIISSGDFEVDNSLLLGTLVFNQMMDIPACFDIRTRRMHRLRMKDEEGLAHPTSFLVDLDLSILMFESKKGGVTLNAFCEYLESNYSIPGIATELVIDPQSLAAFRKMTEIHKFQVAIARVDNGHIFSDTKSSFHQITRAADGTNFSALEYVISSRRKPGLDTARVRGFVSDFLKYKGKSEGRGELRKLVVTGREEDDGLSAHIDFIKNRLRESIDVPTGRWSSDLTLETKLNAMRQAYQRQKPILHKAYGN